MLVPHKFYIALLRAEGGKGGENLVAADLKLTNLMLATLLLI